MTYRIRTSPACRRDLNRLPVSVVPAVLELMFGPLAENPHRVGKPLAARFEGRHSARRGQYRIIYRIDDGAHIVTVFTVRYS